MVIFRFLSTASSLNLNALLTSILRLFISKDRRFGNMWFLVLYILFKVINYTSNVNITRFKKNNTIDEIVIYFHQ